MKKLLLLLAVIILNGCAIKEVALSTLDTIDTDPYVQYIETGKDQNYFIIESVSITHSKKLAKYNYVFHDGNPDGHTKIKMFWNAPASVNDSIFIIIKHVEK